ncbi:diaminopimelate epimerase [Humitalea rosea]|uniref:Diaminopimelate epimerase n=1 Tax=Humitalea rosea TaxID=990373 RepID=A0A2W7IG35_9PROT|nr:diaminopimelate epimerase [Humitalea rosea]PZW45703.1 diaminopimelate epimerase [Humitalea rosea]
MMTPFRKMHGLGNDFVVLDARHAALPIGPEVARAIGDRHRGIGCDQIIILEPPGEGADVFMRIRNPDGSEAGACGNATRCVASLIAAETGSRDVVVRTISGDLPSHLHADGTVTVLMGVPRTGWHEVPLAQALDTLHLPLQRGPLADPAACSMGNPHATFFVPDLSRIGLGVLGPLLETDPIFPERANIGVVQVLARDRLRLVVWERGAGLTLACGSGACAALVNAVRRDLADRAADVELPGGTLRVEWRPDGQVAMTGPVATAYLGTLDLAALRAA